MYTRQFSFPFWKDQFPQRVSNHFGTRAARYSLIRVRENAESIAFYGGVQQELNEIQRRFGKALDNFDKVIRAQRNLEFFTTAYRYLIQVCTYERPLCTPSTEPYPLFPLHAWLVPGIQPTIAVDMAASGRHWLLGCCWR